jgi:hypothetical protein
MMTRLLGISNLLIVASAIVLFFGWVGANAVLIWASIVASVLAGVLMALAYSKSRVQ